jgi:hypothetical protein
VAEYEVATLKTRSVVSPVPEVLEFAGVSRVEILAGSS